MNDERIREIEATLNSWSDQHGIRHRVENPLVTELVTALRAANAYLKFLQQDCYCGAWSNLLDERRYGDNA